MNQDLTNDRFIEWSWAIKFMPRQSIVLDIGCNYSILPVVATCFDNYAVGVDMNNDSAVALGNFKLITDDITKLNLTEKFNYIILCSTLEHIGIPGRYGSQAYQDGDLITMHKIGNFLLPDGKICLTIPVGQDDYIKPYHRIYGKLRLPLILKEYKILEKEFWEKNDNNQWVKTTEEKALETKGSKDYYALGLYLLGL